MGKLDSRFIDAPEKNIIVNGDFEVWNNSTTIASIADADYLSDNNWQAGKTGGEIVLDVTQESDVPTASESSQYSTYSMKLAVNTTPETAVGAGDFAYLGYTASGNEMKHLIGKSCILSFWVKVGVASSSNYSVTLRDSTEANSFAHAFTPTTAGVWEKISIPVTLPDTTEVWTYSNLASLFISFTLMSGSTFNQTTDDSWETGLNYGASTHSSSLGTSASDYIQIAQVQLEEGSEVTIFDPGNVHLNSIAAHSGGGAFYEEGTWTPGAPGGATYSGSNSGYYTKIGNTVFITGLLHINVIGTDPNTISGLPFTSANVSPLGVFSFKWNGIASGIGSLTAVVTANSTNMNLFAVVNNEVSPDAFNTIFANGCLINFSGHYKI